MAKENTHILIAERAAEELQKEKPKISKTIQENRKFFYLGTIFPDSFLYSKNKEIDAFADQIHGAYGGSSDQYLLTLIDKAKKTKNEKEIAYILGFCAHIVADSIFHPAIFYLTGKGRLCPDEKERGISKFQHKKLETILDRIATSKNFFPFEISENEIRQLEILKDFCLKYEIDYEEYIFACKRQLLWDKNFSNKLIYFVVLALASLGFEKFKGYLSLFNGIVKKNDLTKYARMDYKDLKTGQPLVFDLHHIINQCVSESKSVIKSVYGYIQGEMSWEECSKIIADKNLCTGKTGLPLSEIRYSAFDPQTEI